VRFSHGCNFCDIVRFPIRCWVGHCTYICIPPCSPLNSFETLTYSLYCVLCMYVCIRYGI
jgi:hypothetical protein